MQRRSNAQNLTKKAKAQNLAKKKVKFAGVRCEFSALVDTCLPNFCAAGSTCILKERRQTCQNCAWHRNDADEQCRLRALSFDGGYAAISAQLGRLEWTLKIEMATTSRDAILVYAVSGEQLRRERRATRRAASDAASGERRGERRATRRAKSDSDR